MKIYTSYYAKLRTIPDEIVPISIAAKCPEFYTGIQYKKLAPKWGFFQQWKQNHDNDYYIEHFNAEVLDLLDVNQVFDELQELSNGKDVVLLCYEKPSDFCHRHLVADWFSRAGIDCNEYMGDTR